MAVLSDSSREFSARPHTVNGCNVWPLQLHPLIQIYGHFWILKTKKALATMSHFITAAYKPKDDATVALSAF